MSALLPVDSPAVPKLLELGPLCPVEDVDILRALRMLVKCADLSHTAARWEVHFAWAHRLQEELWRQGDLEKKLQLKHAMSIFDRDLPALGVCSTQAGFFNFIALPMYEAFVAIFPSCLPIMDNFESSLCAWMSKITPPVSE